jgi:exodeoxyribonuclease V alpha subunit
LLDKVICLKNQWFDSWWFAEGRDPNEFKNWRLLRNKKGDELQIFVANGELGCVMAHCKEGQSVIVRFENPSRYIRLRIPKRVQHDDGTDTAREEFFALGYAITGHKSQGSECEEVVVSLPARPNRILSRELLYTAVTRAKHGVVIIGSREVVAAALSRRVERVSGLTERLLSR